MGGARLRLSVPLGLVCALLFGATACASDPPPADASAVPTAASVSSGLEGLPVPDGSTRDRSQGVDDSTHQTRFFLVPASFSRSQLDTWYARRLPPQTAWQGWQPCPSASSFATIGTGPGFRRSWLAHGRMLSLLTGTNPAGRAYVAMAELPMDGAASGSIFCA